MRTFRLLTSTAVLAASLAAASQHAHAQSTAGTAITQPPQRTSGGVTRAKQPSPAPDQTVSSLRPADLDLAEAVAPVPADPTLPAEPGDGDDPVKWSLDSRARDAATRDTATRDGDASYIPTDGRIGPDTIAPDGKAGQAPAPFADATPDPAVEAPLSDYDRLAFQIELDPATDKRPSRLARFEPYAPKGMRAGSWVILPEIDAGMGFTSNALHATARRDSFVFDLRPTLRAVTDWRQHALDIRATGLVSRYPDETLADEKSYAFEARGRLDLARRTNLEVLAARRHDVDSPGDPLDLTAERGRARSDANQAAITFNHRFNRLSLQLRGAITDTDFLPGRANDGTRRSNAERDNVHREGALRATWEFKPSLAVFAEYAAHAYDFKTVAADGFNRDSTGDRVRFGVSFGNTAKIWRGEIAAGYGRQNAKDSRLADADGIILDANLAWRPTELTSLLFTAKSDITTSTDPGQALGRSQIWGVELRHAFRRHLIGSVGLKRQTTDYDGTSIREVETTAELGAEYWLNQATSITARYQHIRFDTSLPTGDYDVDTARLGLRWRP